LPPGRELADGKIALEYLVQVNDALTAELIVRNNSAPDFTFENCLHTYFAVGDISGASVAGLKGVEYLDQPADFARRTEADEVIRFTGEVDRVYLNTTATVEIHDPILGRTIRVEKSGANSTVVWNPWIAKARAMPDFGDEEYQRMVCVESGNVAENRITLAPGNRAALKIKLSSLPLK
jgi:D-hexose-6-phosphate mutarotase